MNKYDDYDDDDGYLTTLHLPHNFIKIRSTCRDTMQNVSLRPDS